MLFYVIEFWRYLRTDSCYKYIGRALIHLFPRQELVKIVLFYFMAELCQNFVRKQTTTHL